MLDESRYCADIGMWAVDRPIPISCVHASDYCNKTCYNFKLMKLYPKMADKDIRNEEFWQQLTGAQLQTVMKRKRTGKNGRIRLMTRGEAFRDISDIERVADLLLENPDQLFWIPTRAWRDMLLRAMIQVHIMPIANARILASTDPTTSDVEWEHLKLDGWNTMFFGDDTMTHTPTGDRMFLCPKTHKQLKGHCGICKAGCFKSSEVGRVDVHLSQH